jgi:pimeloyl-ACP methyl ester carboxylesterase
VAVSCKAPARVWHDVFEGLLAYDDAEHLKRITAPTLVLWGERDALFPRSDQDLLAAAIPRTRLKIYPETGHCPNWERPELLVADIDAFVRET